MCVFLDTNILLDITERRPPFFAASLRVLERCDDLGFDIFLASHGLATLFYLTRRRTGAVQSLAVIHKLLSFAEVASVGDAEARKALGYGIADYEDALQAAAAEACGASVLITSDVSGFAGSPVPSLSPDEFLQCFPASAKSGKGRK